MAMKRIKSNRYTIMHPDCRFSNTIVPEIFTPFEVAERLCSCRVFRHIPSRFITSVSNSHAGYVKGPCVTFVHDNEEFAIYDGAGAMLREAPKSEREAMNALNSILYSFGQITA